MKSKTNIFLLLSFLVASVLTIWIYYQLTNDLGDLSANTKIDHDFEVCDESKIPQYFAHGINTHYPGGKQAIERSLLGQLQNLKFRKSGLVTYRFIVNCKGETGRFRFKSTDLDLNNIAIQADNIKSIEKALSSLQNWNTAKNEQQTYDSYYVLNFKIRKGKIVDIF